LENQDQTRIRFYELLPDIYQRIDFAKYGLLPDLYQSEGSEEIKTFIEVFLKGFEDILQGEGVEGKGFSGKGLSEILNRIHDYFSPELTPNEFVDWLAGWLALDISREPYEKNGSAAGLLTDKQRFPYTEEKRSRKRHLIKKLSPLYHLRGTKEGLRQIFDIYFGDDLRGFHINELTKPFVVGDPAGLDKVQADYAKRIGEDQNEIDFNTKSLSVLLARGNFDALGSVVGRSTVVGEAHPYFFIVYAESLVPVSRISGAQTQKAMSDVIDQEKPAHTYYSLKLQAPGMRIGVRDWCDVGQSTLIGGFEI
jgi:phage tail-like protein